MRLNLVRTSGLALAVAVVVLSSVGPAFAGQIAVPTPEIDGSLVVGAAGLLGAGIAILRARRAR